MSTALKLDGRTVRGRIWKDMKASGNALKQGILLNKVQCSHCHEKPDAETDAINCMSCHSAYHITFVLKHVSESLLELSHSFSRT